MTPVPEFRTLKDSAVAPIFVMIAGAFKSDLSAVDVKVDNGIAVRNGIGPEEARQVQLTNTGYIRITGIMSRCTLKKAD